MKVVLFDSILERHLVQSMARALRARKHEVRLTGLTFTGHATTTDGIKLNVIEQLFEAALAEKPDLIVSFRPMNVPTSLVRKARGRGIRMAIWLSDDPVLYRTDSSRVVDEYDLLLHCGSRRILSFYDEKKHPKGVNFPFWTDNIAFPYCYDPAGADLDFVFLGNVVGQVRQKRYDTLAEMPGKLRIFGNVPEDPRGIAGGNIADGYTNSLAVSEALARACCAVNIPQYFDTYVGSEYDFPELRDLGFFQIPSRIVQYAASGLPIISIGDEEVRDVFPELILVRNEEELLAEANKVFAGGYPLQEISDKIRKRFQKSFSAMSRVMLLEKLVSGGIDPDRLSLEERATVFSTMDSSSEDSDQLVTTYGAPSQVDMHYAGALRSILGAADSVRAIGGHIEAQSKSLEAKAAAQIVVEAIMGAEGHTASGADKAVRVSYSDEGVTFNFAEDAPKAGDNCALKLSGFTAADGERVRGGILSFVLGCAYHSPQNQGYLQIETWVNGALHLVRAVGVSGEPELVQIGLPPGRDITEIAIRLRAKVDCLAWRWDNVSVVSVGRFRLERGFHGSDLVVMGSDINTRNVKKVHDEPDADAILQRKARITLRSAWGLFGDSVPCSTEKVATSDGDSFTLRTPGLDLRVGDRSEIRLGLTNAESEAGGAIVTLRIHSRYTSKIPNYLYLYVAANAELCGIEDVSLRAGENVVTVYHPGAPEGLELRVGLVAKRAHASLGWNDASLHQIDVLDIRETNVAKGGLFWSSSAMREPGKFEDVAWDKPKRS